MIDRYVLPEMRKLWSEESKISLWILIEEKVCEEMHRRGQISRAGWKELSGGLQRARARGSVTPARVEELERELKHDVIAFTAALGEQLKTDEKRWVHYGLTSSDVVDTALALRLVEAGELLLGEIEALVTKLEIRAGEFQKLATIGRTHGMFAEPTIFGLKFLSWMAEWQRNRSRLAHAVDGLRFGKLSGAVGAASHWSPQEEARILDHLGLRAEPVSTQVIPRDRHAEFFLTLALCGSSLERIAAEVRLLARSEVAEVRESFGMRQKGSSAMPHKRNPIGSENLTGVARLLRGYALSALENVALWHERDISHSSVERVIGADATSLLHYALRRMTDLVSTLEIDRTRVSANLDAAAATAFSGRLLLALVGKGASREEAYGWVQQCAFQGEGTRAFEKAARSHPEIMRFLPTQEIARCFDLKKQLQNVPEIYRRTLRKGPAAQKRRSR